jgi:hypothetical protein
MAVDLIVFPECKEMLSSAAFWILSSPIPTLHVIYQEWMHLLQFY